MAVAEPSQTIENVKLVGRNRFFPRFRPHPAVRDFGLSAFTSFVMALAAMIVVSLVGRKLGPALLGEYLLVRRLASWLQAGVQVSSGVALPRYIASSIDEPRSTRQTYFLAALLTGCGIALLLSAVLMVWKDAVSRSVFGNAALGYLVLPLGALLLGLAAHTAVFGYYQGAIAMRRGCALQFTNLVFVPILVTELVWRAHSIPLIVNGMGLSMLLGAVLFAMPILRHLDLGAATQQLGRRASELFSYGIVRIPGDFGIQALLSLPAVIAAHYVPIGAVASLLLGGIFLTAVSAATLPLGIILLSRVSKSLAQNRTLEVQVRVSYLVNALIEIPTFVCLQMIVFCDVIVRIWVGPGFSQGIRVIQIVILSVPFYFFSAGLSSVIDAASVKAFNARNVLVSLGAFLLLVVVVEATLAPKHLLEGLAAAIVTSVAVLGCCTLRTVRRLFQIDLKWVQVLPGLGLAATFGMLSMMLRRLLHFEPGIVQLLVFELAVSGVFFALLKQLGSAWMPFLLDAMFFRSANERRSAE